MYELADFKIAKKKRLFDGALFIAIGTVVLYCLTFGVFFTVNTCKKWRKIGRTARVHSELQLNSVAIPINQRSKKEQMFQFLIDVDANLSQESYKLCRLDSFV